MCFCLICWFSIIIQVPINHKCRLFDIKSVVFLHILLSGFCIALTRQWSVGMVSVASKTKQRRVPLPEKMSRRVKLSRSSVFLPEDFTDLGGYDQVLRGLRVLTNKGQLARLGYGVYAKARKSSLSDRVVLDNPAGFQGAARSALNKLKVNWSPTEAEIAYNEGRSTQIPVNPAVRIQGRFSRTLSYGGRELMRTRG